MGDDRSVDETLAEIAAITQRLDSLGSGDPARSGLVAKRDQLRRSARAVSSASRSGDSLRYELDRARRALAAVDARVRDRERTGRSSRWIEDPGSEENRIDRMLRDRDAAERLTLERSIAEIEAQLTDPGAG